MLSTPVSPMTALAAPLWIAIPVVMLAILAARSDVATRRIPNRLTFPALLLGLAAHLAVGGVAGLWSAIAGAGIAMLLLVPGWLAKWMGAGDVKLMAAMGAWLAFPQAVMAVLASLVAGGVLAIVVALRHRKFFEMLRNAAWIGAWGLGARRGRFTAPPITSGVRFPFAVAVLAGSTFALWVHP